MAYLAARGLHTPALLAKCAGTEERFYTAVVDPLLSGFRVPDSGVEFHFRGDALLLGASMTAAWEVARKVWQQTLSTVGGFQAQEYVFPIRFPAGVADPGEGYSGRIPTTAVSTSTPTSHYVFSPPSRALSSTPPSSTPASEITPTEVGATRKLRDEFRFTDDQARTLDEVEPVLLRAIKDLCDNTPQKPLQYLAERFCEEAGVGRPQGEDFMDNASIKLRLFDKKGKAGQMCPKTGKPLDTAAGTKAEPEVEQIVCFPKAKSRMLAGVFARQPQDYEGSAAYKSDSTKPRFIYKLDGCWVMGHSLGDAKLLDLAGDTEAAHPADATGWKKVDVKRSAEVAPALGGCPNVIILKSKFDNLHGGYMRRPENHELYPVFHNSDKRVYLWHDLFRGSWLCSDAVGGTSIFFKIQSNAAHPLVLPSSVLDDEPAITRFEAVTWKDVDPAYLHNADVFTDMSFPPSQASLGDSIEEEVDWIRVLDLNRDSQDLLWDMIGPRDLVQGDVGDCWLIAAFACAAEFPSVIEDVFEVYEPQKCGRYDFKLWDVRFGDEGDWVDVCIDDLIPCKKRCQFQKDAEPLFAKVPPSQELWPVLLEKAFAKLLGSYEELDGGVPVFAWQALTGNNDVVMYNRNPGDTMWSVYRNNVQRQRAEIAKDKSRRSSMAMMGKKEKKTMDEMFGLLCELDDQGVIMGASIGGCDGEMMLDNGLVAGHAFSLLAVTTAALKSGGHVNLVRLRNPWGDDHEWNGDWSDKSKLWKQHPEVDKRVEGLLGHPRDGREDDGIFWMSWHDFSSIFTRIETCKVPSGFVATRSSRGALPTVEGAVAHHRSEYFSIKQH